MLTFDFKNYMDVDTTFYEKKKEEIFQRLAQSSMTGWQNILEDSSMIDAISSRAKQVRENSSVLVVVGVGGSYMGCYALDKMFSSYFPSTDFSLVYVGYQLSDLYLKELMMYLKDKDFSVNVISKSGTTLETSIAFQKLKEFMKTRYNEEEMRKRIIVTTDEKKGALRQEVEMYGYDSFVIPSNVGGRYSVLTPVGLFPLATILDIRKLLDGAREGFRYLDDAYHYASLRKSMYDMGKYVENFVVYEEKYLPFCEWLKQLFAESEGKDNKGVLPISSFYTRDLHSLGQFFQEGTPIVFETVLKFTNQQEERLQNIALESVCVAHQEHTPSSIITATLDEYTMGEFIYFFYLSASFSALLFDVNPFDQPGVEKYKQEMRGRL